MKKIKLFIIIEIFLIIAGILLYNFYTKNLENFYSEEEIVKEPQPKQQEIVVNYPPLQKLNKTEKLELEESLRININTAGVDELTKIKGVGASTARAIIAYRDKHKKFYSLNELTNVPGIGQSKFDKMKDQITLGNTVTKNEKRAASIPETIEKININTAELNSLTKLNGVGPSTAIRIIDYRSENGKFRSIEDIKNVKGIGPATFNKFKDKITVKSNNSYSKPSNNYNRSVNKKFKKIDINRASYIKLRTIPAITRTIAKNIIEYRKKKKIESIYDLRRINGIGYKYHDFEKYFIFE